MNVEEATNLFYNNQQRTNQETSYKKIITKLNLTFYNCKFVKTIFYTLFILIISFLCLIFLGFIIASRIRIRSDQGEIQETFKAQYLSQKLIYNKYNEERLLNNQKTNNNRTDKTINEFKLVCYYNIPPKDPNEGLKPHWIDPFLCTHINVGFASVVKNSIIYPPQFIETFQSVKKLKELNKNLKILITIGGAGESVGFKDMLTDHSNRKQFIQSVINEHKHLDFDGVDLDYEFPMNSDLERVHFTQLLSELRKSIKNDLLLTVAVAAPTLIVDLSYDIPYMNLYVDYVNLMSYDYHFYTKFTPFTGFNSPLYPSEVDKNGYMSTLNINYSATYWNQKGMDRGKIVIGLPTYGHTFGLVNVLNHGLLAPVLRYGKIGTNGFASYPEIVKFINDSSAQEVFDENSKSPYAFKDYEWISYDNAESLRYKTEYVRSNQFGGAMVYALNTDDYSVNCTKGQYRRFQLINVIKMALNSSIEDNC